MATTQFYSRLDYEHTEQEIYFCLCVEYFGVKYFSKDNEGHLIKYFSKHCAVFTDWEGHNHLVLKIYWNYKESYVDILMPEYVTKALECLQHPKPKLPQYSPHQCTVPAYGKRIHMATSPDESKLLDKKITKRIQSIVGNFLYYARSVDSTILR